MADYSFEIEDLKAYENHKDMHYRIIISTKDN